MPTYEYKCPKCGGEFETFQRITSRPGAKCPACGAKAERQMSLGAGLVFKGSGFYLTDYGRSGQKARKDGESSSTGAEKSASEKSGSEKSGSEKSGGDKAGGEKSSESKPAGSKPAETKSKPKKKDD
jgi:putative FmdB family regulatory protein